MCSGPSEVLRDFKYVSVESFISWICAHDTKLFQVEGRPVGNAFIDKVSMSSLAILLRREALPFYDSFFAITMVDYISAKKETKSYGWKRKYKHRFLKYMKEASAYYLSFPLPEPFLTGYISYAVSRVNEGFKKKSQVIQKIQRWARSVTP